MVSTYYIKVGDTRPLTVLLPSVQLIGDLTGATVRLRMREVGSTTLKVNALATVVNPLTGEVRYNWTAGNVNTAGVYLMEWGITYADGTQQTIPSNDPLDGLGPYDRMVIGARLP